MAEPDRQAARQSRVAAEVAAHLARHGGNAVTRTDADAPAAPGPGVAPPPYDGFDNPRQWDASNARPAR